MDTADRWSTPRLAEFVASVTGAADESEATSKALDWATEALEAEIGLILEDGVVLAAVGFPHGRPAAALVEALVGSRDTVDIEGVGVCRLLSTRLEFASAADFVLARAGSEPFTREEIGLLRAAARSLSLTLRLFRALSAERTMSRRLQQRQDLLERLAAIQRSITSRVPLADVLNTITRSARDLLDAEIAVVRLLDPESPSEMLLVAHDGLPADVARHALHSRVGGGAAGRATAENRVVVIDEYDGASDALSQLVGQNIRSAMAAPIRDGDVVEGAITVATRRDDLVFGPLEQEMLTAFAEHASLAITDAKRVEHIQQLAFHDELTGLPNRGLFLERLEQGLIRARRRRGHIAVLFLDLDRFKTINDSLGHTAGDQVLIAVGERLRGCLRDEDTASRLGGDEFAILAHADRDGALSIADRIRVAMEPPFRLDLREVSVSGSIGIALDRGGHADAGNMLRDADTAMYRAKSGRAGGYVVFEPSMHEAALERIDFEAALLGAVGRGEMYLDYQPIVDLVDSRVVGLEALIRWRHPQRGLMSPLEFIPVAEETGQIAALGRWTLEQACTQVRRWQEPPANAAALSIAVNVSPRQLRDARFVHDVARSLARSGLAPRDLVLEITEGAVMVDVEMAIQRLHALRALGVGIAVDDFGTGHSSLALLRRLPVDTIKVDKMFVDTIATDSTAAAFLENIVRMAEILSLQVVVEGVETAAQLAVISSFGSLRGQGYHLGRPAAPAAIAQLLRDNAQATLSAARKDVLRLPVGTLRSSRPRAAS